MKEKICLRSKFLTQKLQSVHIFITSHFSQHLNIQSWFSDDQDERKQEDILRNTSYKGSSNATEKTIRAVNFEVFSNTFGSRIGNPGKQFIEQKYKKNLYQGASYSNNNPAFSSLVNSQCLQSRRCKSRRFEFATIGRAWLYQFFESHPKIPLMRNYSEVLSTIIFAWWFSIRVCGFG